MHIYFHRHFLGKEGGGNSKRRKGTEGIQWKKRWQVMERRGGKEKSEKGGKEARGYKGKRDGMEGERMGRG